MQATSRESLRLEALRRYAILDTEPEPSFDRIARLATRLLDVPMASISFIDEERVWCKASVGLPCRSESRSSSFCSHALESAGPFVVSDAARDTRFVANPYVLTAPHVRFFAGVPIESGEGLPMGVLSVFDRVPRWLGALELSSLRDLAAMACDQLEARAVVQAKRLLDKITGTSPDVIYLFDLDRQRTVYRSCESRVVPGYDRPAGGTAGPRDKVHPDDLPLVEAHLRSFASGSDRLKQQLSYRVGDERGGYRWLLANETVFERDGNGRPTVLLGVASDITELKLAQAELARLAVTDEMTGLPNLRALHERLGVLSAEAARGRSFAVVMLDVDNFKAINDTYGHKVGDEVLKRIARTLIEHSRATDLVARYGGEEFCVLFTDVDAAHAWTLAEKLRIAVQGITTPVPVTASFGVCTSARAEGPDALIRSADDALYRAKRAGRNRVEVAYMPVTTGIRPLSSSEVQARRQLK